VTVGELLLVALSGVAAGALNTVVGSGTLVAFPVLLAVGLSPVDAAVANAVGLTPGALTGAHGYRRELVGQGHRVRRLCVAAAVGGAIGAGLLLGLPAATFEAVVPAMIISAVVLVLAQPLVARWLRERRSDGAPRDGVGPGLWVAVLLVAVYCGYFGAGQGVMLLAVLGIGLDDDLQRVNALKNVVTLAAGGLAIVLFVVLAPVSWPAAGTLAAGSLLGGFLGARLGRRLPAGVYRALIVAVGLIAATKVLAYG